MFNYLVESTGAVVLPASSLMTFVIKSIEEEISLTSKHDYWAINLYEAVKKELSCLLVANDKLKNELCQMAKSHRTFESQLVKSAKEYKIQQANLEMQIKRFSKHVVTLDFISKAGEKLNKIGQSGSEVALQLEQVVKKQKSLQEIYQPLASQVSMASDFWLIARVLMKPVFREAFSDPQLAAVNQVLLLPELVGQLEMDRMSVKQLFVVLDHLNVEILSSALLDNKQGSYEKMAKAVFEVFRQAPASQSKKDVGVIGDRRRPKIVVREEEPSPISVVEGIATYEVSQSKLNAGAKPFQPGMFNFKPVESLSGDAGRVLDYN